MAFIGDLKSVRQRRSDTFKSRSGVAAMPVRQAAGGNEEVNRRGATSATPSL
jgi:hypothetical protein